MTSLIKLQIWRGIGVARATSPCSARRHGLVAHATNVQAFLMLGFVWLMMSCCAQTFGAEGGANAVLPEPVVLAEQVLGASAPNEINLLTLAFSPDEKLIVSGGRDAKALRFWDASSGKEIASMQVPGDVVRFVMFSSDGSKLVTMGDGLAGECAVWDPVSHAMASHWKLDGYVAGAALSPDGKIIAIGRHTDQGTQKNLIELRDVSSGAAVRVIEGREQSVRCIAFSKDGNLLAAGLQPEFGEANRQLVIWNSTDGKELSRFKPQAGRSIEALAFIWSDAKPAKPKGYELFDLPAGGWILAGPAPLVCPQSGAKFVLARGPAGPAVVDLKTGRPLYSLLTSDGDEPMIATISADGRTLAGARAGGKFTVWTTDRATALAAGKLPLIRCQLLLDRSEYLVGEVIPWRCRLTNVSDRELPVYASAKSPQGSAVSLRLRGLGGLRASAGASRGQLDSPVSLAPGASIDLQFPSAGPDAILVGGGQVAHFDSSSSLDIAYVEYIPPGDAAGGRVISQPLTLLRDTGPAFSSAVYSDWIKSSDGSVSVRLHLDSALFSCQSSVFVHGEIRNDSGRKISIRVPQDDLYASLKLRGPKGAMPSSERPSRWPRFVALEPGASTIVYGVLDQSRFSALSDAGDFTLAYRFHSFAGTGAPPDLWTGMVDVPPIKFWRVSTLAQAPRQALRPDVEVSTSEPR